MNGPLATFRVNSYSWKCCHSGTSFSADVKCLSESILNSGLGPAHTEAREWCGNTETFLKLSALIAVEEALFYAKGILMSQKKKKNGYYCTKHERYSK